ncbi:hypothetical protein [Candidatus Tisiphia endosymbiont of Xenochironomus xenolabis]|uniref:hypothetical protein n=1 Tax=Candidatus Tisiphia endosymbiont of Xenochironomus xenolabis TaxID=3139334 RepID=UPI0035C8E231
MQSQFPDVTFLIPFLLFLQIVPQIASEVEKIHSEKVEGINKKFEKLHDITASEITKHEESLQKITDDCLSKMYSTTEVAYR